MCSLTEYSLFGLSFKEQEELSNVHTCKLEDNFFDTFFKFYKDLEANKLAMKLKEVVIRYKEIGVKECA